MSWPWRPACPGPPSARAAAVVSRITTWPAGWLAWARSMCGPDLDEPDGIEAAGVLAGRVVVLGGVSWIERVGVGADPGEAGAPFPPLDAAAVESYAGDLERDGLLLIPARPK